MTRLGHALLFILFLVLPSGPGPLAREPATSKSADQLFAVGKYAAALEQYQELAAHPADEPLADGESEAAATVNPLRRAVRLRERLE